MTVAKLEGWLFCGNPISALCCCCCSCNCFSCCNWYYICCCFSVCLWLYFRWWGEAYLPNWTPLMLLLLGVPLLLLVDLPELPASNEDCSTYYYCCCCCCCKMSCSCYSCWVRDNGFIVWYAYCYYEGTFIPTVLLRMLLLVLFLLLEIPKLNGCY